MSGSERRAAAARPATGAPVATREALYRFRRERGGLVCEEVFVEPQHVRVVRRLAHDVFDIVVARLGAELHKRFT